MQVVMPRGGTIELTRRGASPHLVVPLPPEPGGGPFGLPGFVQGRHHWQAAGDHPIFFLVCCHCNSIAERAAGDAHLLSLLQRLHKQQTDMDADRKSVPDRPGYRHTQRWLHLQLLESIAPEVVSLEVLEEWQKVKPDSDELLHMPSHLLAQMPLLGSLVFWVGEKAVNNTVLHQLPALRHLKSLVLAQTPPVMDIQLLCSTLALTELDLGYPERAVMHGLGNYRSRLMLDRLVHGETSGLQKLALYLPAQEVRDLSMLTGLSSLTSMQVTMWSHSGDFYGLASLTGLKHLQFRVMEIGEAPVADLGAAVAFAPTLAPLSALTGLTCLDLMEDGDPVARRVPPDVSVLSRLSALRVLRCCFFDQAEIVAGDPLPAQFRFLRSATALEELDLGFWGSFWSLPDASACALRGAVSALKSLKIVRILVRSPRQNGLSNYYVPLAAFASAASTEWLFYSAEDPLEVVPSLQSIAEARGCFSALTSLQKLDLTRTQADGFTPNRVRHERIPDSADLLKALPSTQLVFLSLQVSNATAQLMEQIARFRDLQALILHCNSVSLRFVDPLFDLKCLTLLELSLDGKAMRAQHGGAVSHIKADVARLKSAVLGSSHVVGHRAKVSISIREDQAL